MTARFGGALDGLITNRNLLPDGLPDSTPVPSPGRDRPNTISLDQFLGLS